MNKCISLRDASRYRMIDDLTELGYNRTDLFEWSINELKQELYNKQK